MTTPTKSTLTNLVCSLCETKFDADNLVNLCVQCSKPLLCQYDLTIAKTSLSQESLKYREGTLWRYEEMLPVKFRESIVTLREGWTPLIHAKLLGNHLGCSSIYIKDESRNPTGSFKARGLCMAVSKACELGARALAIPSAGNAAGALSAYAAARGIPAYVFMPADVPHSFQAECIALGANIQLVKGLINDCGAKVREECSSKGWFEVSTMREPYRIEGKKTMAYEIAEQLNWQVPDVIIYPTGGGTGLVGMWKAFKEMEMLGLISSKKPRMVAVQSEGCAPIVRAFVEGLRSAPLWDGAKTIADGIRVPISIGDFLVLDALRDSNGIAIAVKEADIIEACNCIGKFSGIFCAPEGGSCLVALKSLLENGWIQPNETVVIFNTGTGIKYSHCWSSFKL